ncbi:hypothetical protein P8452_53503 [Trifolium repens]|nr:hypothetical protein P8452_53503 [Trifolium repens]
MASKLTGNENKMSHRTRHKLPPYPRSLALLYIAPGTKYDGDVAHNVKVATVFIDQMIHQDFNWTPYNIDGGVWWMKLMSFIAGGDDVAEAIEYENSRRFERYN